MVKNKESNKHIQNGHQARWNKPRRGERNMNFYFEDIGTLTNHIKFYFTVFRVWLIVVIACTCVVMYVDCGLASTIHIRPFVATVSGTKSSIAKGYILGET